MPYPTEPPAMSHHMPHGGLLRRALQQAQPPVPPEQWLTQERPTGSIRSQSKASQLTRPEKASQDPQACPAGPSAPQPPASRGRPSRWVMPGMALALILAGVWALSHLNAPSPTQSAPTAHPTPVSHAPTAPAPAASALATPPAASPTPSAPATTGIQQITAQFLAAYFTWRASDSDQTYTSHWRPFVADAAAHDLIQTVPRLTLDDGNDGAATSPTPSIPASAVQISSQQARVQIVWAIRVLPDGGELVQWQTRRIQAAVNLIENTSGWQIVAAAWTSTSA